MPERELGELQELVGQSHRTVEGLRIEPGKVEEFARAVKSEDPVHRDEKAASDRGYPLIPAPLTFTRTGYFQRYRPDDLNVFHGDGTYFGFDVTFDPERTVHGEQAYEYERSLYVGDELTGTTTLRDLFERESGDGGTLTFAVFETEYRDGDGKLVLTERTTFIETASELSDGGS